jgi:hypothetical protein
LAASIGSHLVLKECLIAPTSVIRDSTDREERTYILGSKAHDLLGVHRETDILEFFCECVNRMPMSIERRCAYDND